MLTERLTAALMAFAAMFLASTATAVAAPSNDDPAGAVLFNTPGTPLTRSLGFSGDNTGATYEPDPPTGVPHCGTTAGAGVDYAATVWYRIYPHANGVAQVVVTSHNFEAVVAIYGVDDSTNSCDSASSATDTAAVSVNVAKGHSYFIRVGSSCFDNGTGPCTGYYRDPGVGSFALGFSYDPDSDGDGFLDSVDGCQSTPGPVNGCPNLDQDGDNSKVPYDCNDTPGVGFGIHPGATDIPHDGVDQDCSGPVPGNLRNGDAKYARLSKNPVAYGFKAFRRYAVVQKLEVQDGATVTVLCVRHGHRGRLVRGHGCGFKEKKNLRVSARSGKLSLTRYFGRRHLGVGTIVRVSVTEQRTVGSYYEFTIGSNRVNVRKLCIQPGRRPSSTCPG